MMKRSNLSAAVYLALVFLSGVLIGGVAHRLYTMKSVSASSSPKSPEEWRKKYVEEMRARVALSDSQIVGLEKILDGTRQRYREVQDRMRPEMNAIQEEQVQKIRAMLNESQRGEYEKLRAERELRRKSQPSRHP